MIQAEVGLGSPLRAIRPKDAAVMVVLRRDTDALRVLVGRRSDRHAFMPGKVVFPGGGVDRSDTLAPSVDELHPAVADKLRSFSGRIAPARARAIALSAIRETYEEVGILLGAPMLGKRAGPLAWRSFLDAGVAPRLAPLRLVARAVTPPGRGRRFDARFFAAFSDLIAAEVPPPQVELLNPAWLTFKEAREHPLPDITRIILDRLEERLSQDPELSPEWPVPFFRARNGRRDIQFI